MSQTFRTLSTLVKNNLVEIVIPSNKDQEILAFLEKGELLKKAGFKEQSSEVLQNAKELSNKDSTTNQLKHWQEKGYLIIKIKNIDDWKWHHRGFTGPVWTIPITKQVTRRKGFILKEVINEIVSTNKILALISTDTYLVDVPETILEKSVDFRQEVAETYPELTRGYPGLQMFVLTVADRDNLSNIAREVPDDPLLLYRPYENNSHLDLQGNFVVVGWWGSDIEEIENALQIERTEFPSLTVSSVDTHEKRSTQ